MHTKNFLSISCSKIWEKISKNYNYYNGKVTDKLGCSRGKFIEIFKVPNF